MAEGRPEEGEDGRPAGAARGGALKASLLFWLWGGADGTRPNCACRRRPPRAGAGPCHAQSTRRLLCPDLVIRVHETGQARDGQQRRVKGESAPVASCTASPYGTHEHGRTRTGTRERAVIVRPHHCPTAVRCARY